MNREPYILYVEDDEIEIIKFKNAINSTVAEDQVAVAYNGKEGLDILENNRNNLPKIIILDINMPIMNGLELLEIIKQDVDFKKIPVVMLTTSNNEKDVNKSFQYQVAGYFVKPFNPEEYKKIINIIEQYWNTSMVPVF